MIVIEKFSTSLSLVGKEKTDCFILLTRIHQMSRSSRKHIVIRTILASVYGKDALEEDTCFFNAIRIEVFCEAFVENSDNKYILVSECNFPIQGKIALV